MKRTLALALGLLAAGVGCAPRDDAPPPVRALRKQQRRATIALPLWDTDVAEEVVTDAASYQNKTVVISRAYLDPRREVVVGEKRVIFPLRGGGFVLMPVERVPAWLRGWTGAPLRFRARIHPPRAGESIPAGGPMLTGREVSFAHPLELAFVRIDRKKDGAWLIAYVENFGGDAASATVDLRFGSRHGRAEVPKLAAGHFAKVTLKLSDEPSPSAADLPPQARRLSVTFEDGSAVAVDVGRWLDEPTRPLLDWGYRVPRDANAVLALSVDAPEAALERFAALELLSYLEQSTDASIAPREPTSKEPLAKQPVLVVGTPRHNPAAARLVRQAGLAARLGALGPEGYVLKTLTDEGRPTLLVTATTARGVMHGVYGVLGHYGVQFSMMGARLPTWGKFQLIKLDEARGPQFATRRLIARGSHPASTSLWRHRQWIAMVDVAAKNRYNEVVIPLDGLEDTFTYRPGRSRRAVFPFAGGPYSCLAEAYLGHQHGLAILADYARRRGLDVGFARQGSEGKPLRVAAPSCLGAAVPPGKVGQAIEVLDDPGDVLGLPRLEEAAAAAAALVRSRHPVLSVPYSSGARARASFLGKLAWDKALTPAAYYQSWARTLLDGDAADQLAKAAQAVDKVDGDIVAMAPRPLGRGPAVVVPVQAGDLACNWTALSARAKAPAVAAARKSLQAQSRKLREVAEELRPVHWSVREALGSMAPPWEDPLFEAVSATQRAARISRGFYMLRGLLGGLASAQESALAYYAALADPGGALPRLQVAYSKCSAARRALRRVAGSHRDAPFGPVLDRLSRRLGQQEALLRAWLGPVADASPAARLNILGSDAVVHLFHKDGERIFAAYTLAGSQVVEFPLRAETARLIHRGRPATTLRAEGGAFIIPLDTVPTYIISRDALTPGRPLP